MRSQLLSVSIGVAVALAAQATGGLLTPRDANADGNPATDSVPRVVPYQGTLSRDGDPVTGSVALRFTLWDGEAQVWTEDHEVLASAGRFSVLLGSVSPVESTLRSADALDLSVTVLNGPGPEDDVALTGRQRFVSAPLALWAASAADVDVARDVRVERNLEVDGTARLFGPLSFDARRVGPWVDFSDRNNPATNLRSHECAPDEFICGVQMDEFTDADPERRGDVKNVRFKCCSLGL